MSKLVCSNGDDSHRTSRHASHHTNNRRTNCCARVNTSHRSRSTRDHTRGRTKGRSMHTSCNARERSTSHSDTKVNATSGYRHNSRPNNRNWAHNRQSGSCGAYNGSLQVRCRWNLDRRRLCRRNQSYRLPANRLPRSDYRDDCIHQHYGENLYNRYRAAFHTHVRSARPTHGLEQSTCHPEQKAGWACPLQSLIIGLISSYLIPFYSFTLQNYL